MIRKAQGISQRELGIQAGIPPASVCRWELGQCEPRYFDVECLLDTLGYRLEIVKNESDNNTNGSARTADVRSDRSNSYTE